MFMFKLLLFEVCIYIDHNIDLPSGLCAQAFVFLCAHILAYYFNRILSHGTHTCVVDALPISSACFSYAFATVIISMIKKH